MTHPQNSNEFKEDLNRQSTGSSSRQVIPETILYPPIPNSDALDRYTMVGLRKTKLLRDTPRAAYCKKDKIVSKSASSSLLK